MFAFLFAAQSPYQILAVKIVMAIVGIIMLGVGYYAIRNQRLLISRRQKFFIRLFGVEEITGRWATIGGVVQLLIGVILLAFPIAGPYMGAFTDRSRQTSRYNAFPSSTQRSSGSEAFEAAKAEMEAEMRARFVDSEGEFDPLPPLGNPERPLPSFDAGEDSEFVASTKLFGGGGSPDSEIADLAEAGGVLVGLRATVKTQPPRSLTSITPIYQVDDKYRVGEIQGQAIGKPYETLAKPGHVATGAKLNSRGDMEGLQLRFQPVNDDGSLANESEAYWGNWIGRARRAEEVTFAGPITGLTLSVGDFPYPEIEAIGFAYINTQLKALAEPARTPLPILPEEFEVQSIGSSKAEPDDFLYQAQAPRGGIMVGLQVMMSERGAGRIASMRPIFLTGNKYSMGKLHGAVAGDELLLARDGYAVSGLKMSSFSRGVQLRFSKVLPAGKLNLADSYESAWIGSTGDRVNLDSQGMPVVGFSYVFEEFMERLVNPSIAVAKLEPPVPTKPAHAGTDTNSENAPAGETTADMSESAEALASTKRSIVRTWTSQNGKQVEAELIGFEAATKKFILRRVKDNRVVKIPANAFGEQDRDILKAWWLENREKN